jgi:hypothetical protein
MRFDVFNGDADGLCAVQQFRLANTGQSQLVTGVKRDIALLKKVQAADGDEINVFDISLDKNREPLVTLLAQGVVINYFDHHFAGDIPASDNLKTLIDTAPDTCTSLIVDQYLQGKYRAWAVVGAFGDNFDASARQAAEPLGLSEEQLLLLRDLGNYLNYNGYGATIEDLHFDPTELAARMQPYTDPLQFIEEEKEVFETLRNGSNEDFARARAIEPEIVSDKYAVLVFPADAWARRVSGVYSNDLASTHPDRAHALLTRLPQGGYVVSVRAPLNNKTGADDLCRQFPTGGGRKAAAGINELPEAMLDEFVAAFKAIYS